jgi:hypothetical protein
MGAILGSSIWTSLFGYLIMGLTVANQVFVEQGMPKGVEGWAKFGTGMATGIALRVTQDANMTFAKKPMEEQKAVSPVLE